MGAWGPGNFENDAARDWLAGLEEPDQLRETLSQVANAAPDDYLRTNPSCAALAAAEVVAAGLGQASPELPEEVFKWLADHPDVVDSDLVSLARRAIERVESGSKLQELFDEDGPDDDWHAVLNSLRARLAR
jgi:hypothetical protein